MSGWRSAARADDAHSCPRGAGEGGAVRAGSQDVWIDGRPAARAGDLARCCGPSDRLEAGAPGVYVNWHPLAREGDATRHGGRVAEGSRGVLVGDLGSPGDARAEQACGRIESDFALRRFRGLARRLPWTDFARWCAPIFGVDLPMEAYRRLHGALRAGAVSNPDIVVWRASVGGASAAYDQRSRRILVSRAFAEQAARDRPSAWKLLFALVEEFGHHVDRELRTSFAAAADVEPDAPLDEGAAFAFALVHFRFAECAAVRYGRYLPDGAPALALEANWSEVLEAVETLDREAMILDDGRSGTLEFFDAKEHGDVARALADPAYHAGKAPFTAEESRKVYFGNWLNDWSQVVSPFTLSLAPKAFTFLTEALKVDERVVAHGASRAASASRAVFTAIARTLAIDAFTDVYGKPDPQRSWSDLSMPEGFEVTVATFGVYRPEHHVDNPETEREAGHLDAAFRAPYEPAEGEVDPKTWMKRYILDASEEGAGAAQLRTPVGVLTYLSRQLALAAQAPKHGRGYVALGRALHVIEDFYAHSNFVELSLATKHPGVQVWVREVELEGAKVLPLVTGIFGSLDMGVSLLDKLARALDPEKKSEDGQLTLGDRITIAIYSSLELYRAKDNETLAWALAHLRRAYKFGAPKLGHLRRLYKKARDYLDAIDLDEYAVRKALRAAAQRAVVWLIRQAIEEARAWQTRHGAERDAEGTDPTHSQIGKDREDHPLHGIAMECARWAVADVGRELAAVWAGTSSLARLTALARGYIAHPLHPKHAGTPQVNAQRQHIDAWGKRPENAALVKAAGEIPAGWAPFLKELEDKIESWKHPIGAQLRQRAPRRVPRAIAATGGAPVSSDEEALEDWFEWMRDAGTSAPLRDETEAVARDDGQ